MKFTDWGIIDYKEAWDKQNEIFTHLISIKNTPDYLKNKDELQQIIFCEHPHVYTLGRNGNEGNMLIQEDRLAALGATYYKTDRGGDITYHGYGQIVVYPIVDLDALGLSLKQYVCNLEEAVIQTLAHYNIKAGRADGATGVWFDYNTSTARKICAIGVRASRYVTMHGLAFNVSTDLSYYNHINPCGFVDKGVTSLEKEIGKSVNIEEVKNTLKKELIKLLHT
ncbi:lipoyl(octanoyl) transferase [Dysgonomonas alginatilytica]|uniref:Octanoyltransferase n=1 Tax=Dysgonomonas alginatilytica TaxID=1605892 RepID=A0A2V3PLZ2_9BACT|nr:lipoyl(octanoyl) transferase LipB [Dysgonomonas alginatilytica]PXV60919.1 lipoyl(octanoyl) transferase [Dysgonomonas alginatilytica]